MNIAVCITNITRKGGTERAVVNLANYLHQQSQMVTVVSFNTTSGEPFFNLDKDIGIIHLGLDSYLERNVCVKWKCYVVNLLKCLYKLRHLKYDVTIGSSRNVNVMLLLSQNSRKIVGCEHFSYNSPISLTLSIIRNISYKYLDRLVVLTPKDADYYEKRKILVDIIPNAIPFNPEICTQKDKIFLAVGRHSKEKAFEKIIRIWAKSSCKDRGWSLYIVGDGPLLEENKRIATSLNLEDSIRFLPPTPNIAKYYRIASIYVMTSLYEAFPMVLLEAKAFQIPLVAYDCETGPRAIIKNGTDGYLVAMDDDINFIKKMEILAMNDNKRSEFGEKAYQDSFNYSEAKIMPLWDKLLQSLFNE